MPTENLAAELILFVRSRRAKYLCQSYSADPASAVGYLYERLAPKLAGPIKNLRAWCWKNATGLLRNYLRQECRPLIRARSGGAPVSLFSLTAAGFPAYQPGDLLEEREAARLLNEEMARLPIHFREALFAWARVHPERHSCRSLAKARGVAPQTIVNRADQARRLLRVRLEGRV